MKKRLEKTRCNNCDNFYQPKESGQRYCTRYCYNEARVGKPHPHTGGERTKIQINRHGIGHAAATNYLARNAMYPRQISRVQVVALVVCDALMLIALFAVLFGLAAVLKLAL